MFLRFVGKSCSVLLLLVATFTCTSFAYADICEETQGGYSFLFVGISDDYRAWCAYGNIDEPNQVLFVYSKRCIPGYMPDRGPWKKDGNFFALECSGNYQDCSFKNRY